MARGPSPRDEAGRRDDWQEDSTPQPWLDEADDDVTPTHTLVGRGTFWTALLLGALLLIGVAVGLWLIAGREKGAIDVPPPGAELPLVRSPGPWKEPATGPGTEGKVVEGQGQARFGTGDGIDPGGRIALEALPEAPVERPRPAPAAPAEPEPAPTPAEGGPTNLLPATQPETPKPVAKPAPAPAPAPAPKAAPTPEPAPEASRAAGNGSILQLGAFSSEARARTAWKNLSERFGYLAGLDPLIQPTVRDGKTLYRLRTGAADQATARDLCARLKVAGESCTIVGP
ncbi:MAG: SPOR domain-containing protein [Sphingomonadaceae bacterium]